MRHPSKQHDHAPYGIRACVLDHECGAIEHIGGRKGRSNQSGQRDNSASPSSVARRVTLAVPAALSLRTSAVALAFSGLETDRPTPHQRGMVHSCPRIRSGEPRCHQEIQESGRVKSRPKRHRARDVGDIIHRGQSNPNRDGLYVAWVIALRPWRAASVSDLPPARWTQATAMSPSCQGVARRTAH